ncbi:nucleotidyltransferase family protein [Gudongella sp. SC589]|jgi:molybdenum cofactor cytidylyltransferase|uniref:nucleotidyltransferase family protein n=1 Tax=Gudongella sp. SC589 TaxID=3385990 RepID=UPI0039047F40
MPKIDGIILAAGFSRRMGRDKLLLPIGQDLVVERVVKTALRSRLSKIILVYRNARVAEIGKRYGVETIKNTKARLGQAESVKSGLKKATGDGYLFIAGDQPFLSCSLVNGLTHAFAASGKGIIIPTLDGEIQMPILFSKKYREDLEQVYGEKGGFEIISGNKDDIHWYHVKDHLDVCDIDTETQYRELIHRKDRIDNGL